MRAAGPDREFPPLLPQLMSFIDLESKKLPLKNKEETIFFEEGDRKGYLSCVYVAKGTRVFGLSNFNEPVEPMLNITHVVIQKHGSEKNIIQRISREVLENPNIKGVRIESILSDKWLGTFERPWVIKNENNAVLLKPLGGKTRKRRKKTKKTMRKDKKKA